MDSLPQRRSPYPKPIIGIVGGIGAGKSVVAQTFRELGCAVIDSDKVAHDVLRLPEVAAQLRAWWGDGILDEHGHPDRRKIAHIVFPDPAQKHRLESLVHPKVGQLRETQVAAFMADPHIRAVIYDTPLLYEVGLDRYCDAVVFVKAPLEQRLQRVAATRHWTAEELARREKSQFPLDKKQLLADYIVDNSGEATALLRQVRDVFSLILSRKAAPA